MMRLRWHGGVCGGSFGGRRRRRQRRAIVGGAPTPGARSVLLGGGARRRRSGRRRSHRRGLFRVERLRVRLLVRGDVEGDRRVRSRTRIRGCGCGVGGGGGGSGDRGAGGCSSGGRLISRCRRVYAERGHELRGVDVQRGELTLNRSGCRFGVLEAVGLLLP